MADVNWTKYRCDICLMLGLAVAAVVSALIGWLLLRAGLPVAVASILFLVVWAILGWMVDSQCRKEARAAARAAREGAAAADEAAEAERRAAEAADAERRAAEAAAEAQRRADAAEHQAVLTAGTAASPDIAAGDPVQGASDFDDTVDRDGDGIVEGREEGIRPTALDAPRGGQADDLKRIKGIGPKLEKLCNELGFWHFDQIAAWTADEVAWVDANLEGFRGRVTRDQWVAQAKTLAEGGETDFSRRVDDGDVPSSQ